MPKALKLHISDKGPYATLEELNTEWGKKVQHLKDILDIFETRMLSLEKEKQELDLANKKAMLSLEKEKQQLDIANKKAKARVQGTKIQNDRLCNTLHACERELHEVKEKYEKLKKRQTSTWNRTLARRLQQVTAENHSLHSRLASMQVELDHKNAQVQMMLQANRACPLCQDAPACNAALCGHLVACDGCLIHINRLDGRCPICRDECLSCDEGQPDLLRVNL